MNGLGDWISYNADWAGDRIALSLGDGLDDESYTYESLDRAVDQRCHLLNDLGAKPGDQIAYLGYNSCELIILLFACARTRCLLMPLNNRLAEPEHRWILQHSGARFLIYEGDFSSTAFMLIEHTDIAGLSIEVEYQQALALHKVLCWPALGSLDDPVLLLYTSGTTGNPKGVVHKQRALFYNALNAIHAQGALLATVTGANGVV